MNEVAIILAGGKGRRFGTNKQFVSFNGIPLFIYTLRKFSAYTKIVTIPRKFSKQAQNYINKYKIKDVVIINGGKTRQESVLEALKYVKAKYFTEGKVIITDANRPFITKLTIKKCLKALDDCDAIIATSKSVNTTCDIVNGELVKVYPRENMYDLLMPQCFDFASLYTAHIKTNKVDSTDDTQILTEAFPEASINNIVIPYWEGIKLTHPEDFDVFNVLLRRNK